MSLLGNILVKLGLKQHVVQPAPSKPTTTTTHVAPPAASKPAVPSQGSPRESVNPKSQVKPPVAPQHAPGQRPITQVGPKPQTDPQNAPKRPLVPQSGSISSAPLPYMPDQHPAPQVTPTSSGAPIEIPMVDVVSKLEQLAAANTYKLDWKVSIVDLLKLLGLDSSFKARKELAIELGCPADKMSDSAQMNTWLHKTVLQKIAENGGNIPRDLID